MVKILMLITLLVGVAEASTIAVIDSGVDLMHRDFYDKSWTNPGEIRRNRADDDNNGYVDDVNGWNFAGQNNQIIDYKYLNTFSEDPYRFFEIQRKIFEGSVLPEEKAWLEARLKDQAFIKELSIFGNFVHGTHVAGIAADSDDATQIMALKLIPTEVQVNLYDLIADLGMLKIDGLGVSLFKIFLSQLAAAQAPMMNKIGNYLNTNKADIANCSFGTGYGQIHGLVKTIWGSFSQNPLSQDELDYLVKFFIGKATEGNKKMVDAAQNTLFVFAAGNEGLNSDKFPTTPANIRTYNTITVAATYKRNKLASFSNYGAEMVDVAAPGVGIDSAVPGNERLAVSGTSQAAPYVANVANQIKNANPNLNPFEVKRLLIETVDVKNYLAKKVKSSGIVNPKRALKAAELSVDYSLNKAIKLSMEEIQDIPEEKEAILKSDFFTLPLPSQFKY